MSQKKRLSAREPGESMVAQRPRSIWFWILVGSTILLVGAGIWVFADWWICLPDDVQATFVGRQSCVDCHPSETRLWEGSDHDRAMDVATDKTVLGDFNNAEMTHHDIASRMFRKDGRFFVHTEGPDGEMADFEVKYVLGVRPLQNYMVEFDRPEDMPENEIARLQVLRITWDTEREEWFYLPPPDVPEKLDPKDDDMHWTRIAQCWNNMCAYCHSTDLQKNYDVETGTYHTTFFEIDVSCEACHGPASLHVELANSKSLFWDRKRGYGLAKLKTEDTRPQIQMCAPCHSRRGVLHPNFRPGDDYYDFFNNELLEEQTYFADGQIKDEDYVYGSFIQSKMFHEDIRCTDCHDPHTARLKHEGNKVCTSCHQHPDAKYDTPAHHFHKTESTGASCAECHMQETTYMEVDPRRDHSIRIPRPDLSIEFGLPNACTQCHLTDAKISDKKRASLKQYIDWIAAAEAGDEEIKAELRRLDEWMLESMKEWYEKDSWGDSFARALVAGRTHQAEAADMLAQVARDRQMPGIVRASAIRHRSLLPTAVDLSVETDALSDEDPQVRTAAVARFSEALQGIGNQSLSPAAEQQLLDQVAPFVRQLTPLLDDTHRAVRSEVGRVLAQLPPQLAARLLNGRQRGLLDQAIEDYITGLMESNDRAGAHMQLGVLYETMGRNSKARKAYRTAIQVEPNVTGPRTNLAAMLDRLIVEERQRLPQGPASEWSVRMQQEVEKLRDEELVLMKRDVRFLPDSAGIQYRYGLALYLKGEKEEAERALSKACELEPDNRHFLYTLVLFYDRYERYAEALRDLDRLIEMSPENREYRQLRLQIERKAQAAGPR